jgi:hypothetical protein
MPTFSSGPKKNLLLAVSLAALIAIPVALAGVFAFNDEACAATITTAAAPTDAATTAATDPAAQAPGSGGAVATDNAAGAVTAAGQAVSTLAAAENTKQLGSAVGDFWKLAWEKARPFLTQVWGALSNIFAHFWNWLSSIAKEPPAPANANTNAAAATNININSDAPSPAAGE